MNTLISQEYQPLLKLLNDNYPQTLTGKQIIESLDSENNWGFVALATLIYLREVEVFNNPIIINNQQKLKLKPIYRKYLTYFINNSQPDILFASYHSRNNYKLSRVKLDTMLLLDGEKTDEELLKYLSNEVKAGRIEVNTEDGRAVDEHLKEFIADIREFVLENLMNTN